MTSTAPTAVLDSTAGATLAARFTHVRAATRALVAGLSAEDAQLQSMPDASPSKWHLAHTTWFFERFVLMAAADYQPVQPQWLALFNSYYQSLGPLPARHQRGLMSRPRYAQVLDYRARLDDALLQRLQAPLPDAPRSDQRRRG